VDGLKFPFSDRDINNELSSLTPMVEHHHRRAVAIPSNNLYATAFWSSSPLMATKPAVQAAALLSLRGLRRRRLGHIGPNHYQSDLDKWGRKKINGTTNSLLGVTGSKRPVPRASLVLGGQPPLRRRNGLDGLASKKSVTKMNGNDMNNENGLLANAFEQRLVPTSRSYANGASGTNGLNGSSRLHQRTSEHDDCDEKQKGGGQYSSDLVVVLDMDECLIHSQFLSDQLVDKYRQVEDRPATSSSSFHQGYDNEESESIILSTCQSFRISLPDGDLVNVNKRPNLDIFLKEITSRYETYIFTAAMEVYASPVLDVLDPHGEMFRGRFYRDTCVYSPDLGVYAKDLCHVLRERKLIINSEEIDDGYCDENDCLECDERRVVLVDNNPLSFLPNPSNGILVSSFYDDPKDDTLEAVMELLYELDESDDVRPILDEKFGLKDALNDVVKGTPGW
jgi:CTD small phosphatase-like protein 2